MARKYSQIELGMGYGVVVGGAVGIVLLAATGSAVWLGIGFMLGLVGGMIWGQLADARSDSTDPDPSPTPESSRRPDGHEGGS